MSTLDSTVLRDENRRPVWWGLSSTDGVTLVPIKINSSNGGIEADIDVTTSAVIANLTVTMPREGNRVPVLCGVSDADSTILIPVSVNPATGGILMST